MAPFLILIAGVNPVTAIGTDLIYGAVTKIVGGWIQLRQGAVDLPVVRRLALGSVPGGIAGALLMASLPRFTHNAGQYAQKAIGILLVIVAIVLVGRMFFPLGAEVLSEQSRQFLYRRGTIIWGAIVGFCVGATSVGSGSLLAPFLLMLYPSKTAKVVGTDLFHAAILVSVTGLAHAAASHVDWQIVPALLAGSIPGVLVGSRLVPHIPTRSLRFGLATLLLITGCRMF